MTTEEQAHRDGSTSEQRARTTTEWFPATNQRLRISRTVMRPVVDVERALRVRPDHLVRVAYGLHPIENANVTILLSPLASFPSLGVPVEVQFSTPPATGDSWAVLLVSWRATRFSRCFPVFEAGLSVHPGAGATELLFEGTYRPPLGLLGLIFDFYIGKRVATKVATDFVEALSDAIEKDETASSNFTYDEQPGN